VVVEVALSLVLLVGTVLVLRSYRNVTSVEPGFDPDRVLVMRTTLPRAKYQGPAVTAFFERLEQRVAAVPGVAAAGLTNKVPVRGFVTANFTSDHSNAEPVRADYTLATSAYFRALRIPLRRGRLFEPADKAPAILNERAAARLFPNADPIGRRIRPGPDAPWSTVVGVVGDTRNHGVEQPPEPEVFVPVARDGGNWNQLWLVVRASGEPAAMFRAIRETVRSIDPDQPLYLTMTLREMLGFTLLRRTAAAWLLTVFGAVALRLATVGLYGVVAYSVARRTREIGVRIALGATRADVMRLVLGHGMRLALAGVAAGAVVAALSTRFASTLLFNVSPTDPLAFAATAALLLATTLLASYLPARRSAKVDPNVALRYE
jgi:predicted permease